MSGQLQASLDSRNCYWAAIILGVVAVVLRLYRLGDMEVWLDEALTGYLGYSDDWLQRVHNTPPLYYWIVRNWLAISNFDASSLRLPSVVAGGLFVVLATLTANEIFGRRAGIFAGLFAALSPLHLYYSQEARAYSLLMTEIMFVYLMLWRTARGAGTGSWIGLVVGTAMAVYTHFLAIIPVGIGYLVIAAPRGLSVRVAIRYIAALLVAMLAVVPWLIWWKSTTEFAASDFSWVERVWAIIPIWRQIPLSLEVFYLGSQQGLVPVLAKQFLQLEFLPILRWLGLFSLTVVLLFSIWRCRLENADVRARFLQSILLVFVPLLLLLGVSFFRPIYIVGRYDLVAFPAFVIWLGFALSLITSRKHGVSIFGAILIVCALVSPITVKLINYFEFESRSEADQIARQIIDAAEHDDLFVMVGPSVVRLVYYLRTNGIKWEDGVCRSTTSDQEFRCRMLPLGLEVAPAAVQRYYLAARDGWLIRDIEQVISEADYPRRVRLVFMEAKRNQSGSLAFPAETRPVLQKTIDSGYAVTSVDTQSNVVALQRRSGIVPE
ncbi:MAG: glycosyltransferase family 39 protein [Gammaproteobacteria bacterium]|nr:glycosyltransferase family 39 protein [Gammaproteobacteria bacterium]